VKSFWSEIPWQGALIGWVIGTLLALLIVSNLPL